MCIYIHPIGNKHHNWHFNRLSVLHFHYKNTLFTTLSRPKLHFFEIETTLFCVGGLASLHKMKTGRVLLAFGLCVGRPQFTQL